MLRLRAWVFFLFLLLIGALLVATAPSFQTCLNQAGPQAASSQPQRHGTTVTAARTTRDCLARFFTENRDDIIAGLALILAGVALASSARVLRRRHAATVAG